MYIAVDDIKNEVSLYYPIDNKNGNKNVGPIRTFFVYSFIMSKRMKRSTLKMANTTS